MFEEGEIDGEEEEILEQEKHDMNIYTLIKINKYINKYIYITCWRNICNSVIRENILNKRKSNLNMNKQVRVVFN